MIHFSSLNSFSGYINKLRLKNDARHRGKNNNAMRGRAAHIMHKEIPSIQKNKKKMMMFKNVLTALLSSSIILNYNQNMFYEVIFIIVQVVVM